MTITHSGEKFDLEKEVKKLEKKGIFDKKVSIEYAAENNVSQIHFRDDGLLSFRLNVLDLEDQEEAEFWLGAEARKEKLKFNGYVNLFYPFAGRLRGYMSSEDEKRKLLLSVRKGRAERVITERKLIVYHALSFNPQNYLDKKNPTNHTG